MIGVAAFFAFFLALIIGTLIGGGCTLTTTLILKANSRTDKMRLWLIGAGIGFALWVLILLFQIEFSSGGAPTAEDYGNMIKLFVMVGLTPGFLMLAGGFGQLLGIIRGEKKRNLYKKVHI